MPPAFLSAYPVSVSPRRPARLLKTLIWTFCAFLIAGTWWFVIEQIGFERRQARDDAIRQNVNRSIAFEQYVRRTLEGADLATRYIAERFASANQVSEFVGTRDRPRLLRGSVARTGSFLGVSIADEHGDIVATSVDRPLIRTNVLDHPAFRVHLARDNGHLFVSPPAYSRVLRRPVIWLSRRLNHPDGTFAGVVAINISPDQFTNFYRDASIGPMDVMSVIGLDGITRARRTGPLSSAGEDLRGLRVMREQMRNPNGTYLGPSALDGKVRYFSHRRLPDYGLFVTYGVLESGVFRPSQRRAGIFIAGAAALSLVLFAFALFLTLGLTRRERREAEIEQTNLRLQEAQRIGRMGDWEYDLVSDELHWSPQLLAMFGRDPTGPSPTFEEFKAQLSEHDRATVQRATQAAIRTGDPQHVELTVRLPGGADAHYESAVIPTHDSAGRVVRLHGINQDVSERRLLDALEAEVAHLSRLEAMNAMAATLAHELNQPLTAASNFLVGSRKRLASGDPTAAREVEQGIVAAEERVHLAADIIRRVREMVANQPKSVTRVSLSQVIDDAVVLASLGTGDRKVLVTKQLARDATVVDADRIQIQQVLINLIRNAQDAVADEPQPEILISSCRHDGKVTISVSDNGPGFSQADHERFSPFATTKATGLGLGLSISRTIIEAHGGRIWTENEEGEGARVCFTLAAPTLT